MVAALTAHHCMHAGLETGSGRRRAAALSVRAFENLCSHFFKVQYGPVALHAACIKAWDPDSHWIILCSVHCVAFYKGS